MSHKATGWAIQQRGLDPATKLLLWYLADCHNGHTGRCDPRQEMLAYECEMSRATVNRHLDKLEAKGLIQRVRRVNRDTMRQEATQYELAIDGFFNEEVQLPVSQNDTRDFEEPCLNNGHSRVSNIDVSVSHSCDTHKRTGNLTGNLTGNSVREAEFDLEAEKPKAVAVDRFEEFWKAYPKKAGKADAIKAWAKAIRKNDPAKIIAAAKVFASKAPADQSYIKFAQGWLNGERFNDPEFQESQAAVHRSQVDIPGFAFGKAVR